VSKLPEDIYPHNYKYSLSKIPYEMAIEYTDPDEVFAALLNAQLVQPKVVQVWVAEAFNRVLAEEVTSPIDVPAFNSSHLDGYALRSIDTVDATPEKPIALTIRGFIDLGVELPKNIQAGEAYRVRTGSYLPEGCDAVVGKEDVYVEGEKVRLKEPVRAGAEVVRKGSDVAKGMVVLRAGHRLRAQDLGMLRLLRYTKVKVYAQPIVAVASIGSELTESVEEAEQGKTLNTHAYTLSALIKSAGGKPLYLGIVPDDMQVIKKMVLKALSRSSLLLTIGGSSVGEADLVSKALEALTPTLCKHGLQLHPGRVAGCCVINGKAVLTLPGLIQSTINAFVYLALPLIKKLTGSEASRYDATVRAKLAEDLTFHRFPDFKKMTWVSLKKEDRDLVAYPIRGDSPMLNVLVKADGYILTPPNQMIVKKDTYVDVALVLGLSSLP
jgi:molybdenum cofactor synthesis domain-containing protein